MHTPSPPSPRASPGTFCRHFLPGAVLAAQVGPRGGGWAVCFARCHRPKEQPSEGPGAAGTLPRLRQLGHTQAQSSASSTPGPGWFCILGPTPLAPAFTALQPFHRGWPQRSGSSQGVSHGTHRRAHRRGAGPQPEGGGGLVSPHQQSLPSSGRAPWLSGHQPCCTFPERRKEPVLGMDSRR